MFIAERRSFDFCLGGTPSSMAEYVEKEAASKLLPSLAFLRPLVAKSISADQAQSGSKYRALHLHPSTLRLLGLGSVPTTTLIPAFKIIESRILLGKALRSLGGPNRVRHFGQAAAMAA